MKLFEKKNKISIDVRQMANRLEELGDADVETISRVVAEELGLVSDSASLEMAHILLSNASEQAAEQAKFRRAFEARLRRSWKEPLEMYEVIHALCTELGSDLNRKCRSEAAGRQDFKFEALTRLHGRACLTGSEIGALLRSGHATGANARWRTLHEIAVVAMFIAERDQSLAKRYLEHDSIARWRASLEYQKYAQRLGYEPLSPNDVDRANRTKEELVARYGAGYESDYGWAAHALGNKKPRFVHLSEAIELKHWTPYIRLASDAIHAGPHGGFFDIGLHPSIEAIPAGPSHFGLADPGGNALISLHQVTITLMVHCLEVSLDSNGELRDDSFREQTLTVIKMKMLQILVDKADETFVAVHRQQEAGPAHISEAPRVLDLSS